MIPREKRVPRRVLAAVLKTHWAIDELALRKIHSIVRRQNGDVAQIAQELGRPLDNSRTITMRGSTAVIPIDGPLVHRASMFDAVSGATSYEQIALDLGTSLRDDDVKAIVLEVDSPGGEVAGMVELANLIYAARGQKPIVAYVGDEGCSAAYLLAASADRIVGTTTSKLGCIGTCATLEDDTKHLESNGVEQLTIVSSQTPDKNLIAQEGFTDRAVAQLKGHLSVLAGVMIERIAKFRGVKESVVLEKYGKGDILIGANALEAGLVDELGSFEELIAQLAADAPARTPEETEAARAQRTAPIHRNPASAQAGAQPARAEEKPMERDTEMHDKLDGMKALIEKCLSNDGMTHSKLDEQKGMHAKTHGMLGEMDDKDDKDDEEEPGTQGSRVSVQTTATGDWSGIVAAMPPNVAREFAGKTTEQCAMIITAMHGSVGTVASAEATEKSALIEKIFAEHKLDPTAENRTWAEGRSLAALKDFHARAKPGVTATNHAPPAQAAPAGSGSIAVLAAMAAPDQRRYLLAQFEALPQDQKKMIDRGYGTGAGTVEDHRAAYMRHSLTRPV